MLRKTYYIGGGLPSIKHLFFLFFGIIIIACTSDNEQDYFHLDNECNTDDLYYIANDEARSIAAIIANKCATCHFQGNYNSEVVLETYGQLINIDFGIKLKLLLTTGLIPAGLLAFILNATLPKK